MKQNKKRPPSPQKRKKGKRLKLQNHARPKDYGDDEETKRKKGKKKEKGNILHRK